MRTGRLSIGRGHGDGAPPLPAGPRLRLVPTEARPPEPESAPVAESVAPAPAAAPATLDYHLVHDRLTALERLARLYEQGTLSMDEFAAEKAAILRLPAEELVLRAEAASPPLARIERPRGPSLIGRLLNWKLLPAGLAGGLALSWYAQPRETLAFLEQAGRYLGV